MPDEIQKETQFTPASEYVISDLETLKLLSEPLRIQILEHLAQPHTVKQLAKELGVVPTKLYYHINMLEERGLITVTDTRIVSGIIEKQYQISAWRYRPADNLISLTGPEGNTQAEALLTSIFDVTKEELKNSIRAGLVKLGEEEGTRSIHMTRSLTVLTPERAQEFSREASALFEKFCYEPSTLSALQPGEQIYALTFVLYPTQSLSKEETDGEPDRDQD